MGLLAIHPGALGDLVLFGRLLERLGGCDTLVAGGEKARLLEGLGLCRRALAFESLAMHEVFGDSPPERCSLRAALGRCHRLVSCFAGDGLAQGRLMEITGAARGDFLPVRPPGDFDGHLLDLWCRLLGDEPPSGVPRAWPVPPQWLQQAEALLDRLGVDATRGFAVLHPGSGGLAKCWPMRHFAAVAARLPAPVALFGPAELDRRWDARALQTAGAVVVESPTLEVLAGLLARCEVFVGNDSGVCHLSAAVGAHTVALFGPTSPRHFQPLGPRVHVLAAESMDRIDPAGVMSALARRGG